MVALLLAHINYRIHYTHARRAKRPLQKYNKEFEGKKTVVAEDWVRLEQAHVSTLKVSHTFTRSKGKSHG
ncbi:hypothetical protein HMPREF3192_00207 [Atopobium deltae]|uniref:Uncharacterized protein n=1 Tax=Atopobium deltae TaxID=1393034 RepID=A0A133XX74_9ACTN|nr:hypothetical protein HMPREF3192_00207 [Atopobium deltae]